MQTVLLDTDYVIDFLRGKSSVIIPLLEKNIAFLSILSVYELYAGMRPHEEEATTNFIQACRLESVTIEIAKNAGAYRFKQRQKGITLSIVDCIIAETANMNNHLVATNNKKHYPGNSFWPKG
jgi:predicted nucleic acid-binding protein